MAGFFSDNPPPTQVGSEDAAEATIQENAVSQGDTSSGFFQGSPAQTTTDAYTADALTSKNAAEAAQTAAELAETNAEAAETNAEAAETAAELAKTAAELAETNAETAETNAAGSATSATDSASTATTKASEAAASAGTASTASTSATNSSNTATTKASEASTSASNAASSSTAAANSATTSATQAQNSSTSAASSLSSKNASVAAKTAAETAETNAETAETNAAGSATAAAGSATAATNSSSTASSQASASATQASSSATSATSSSNSAASAATAQTAAEAARDSALAALDSFDDRYLGSKSSAPSVDNDGNALVAGALYFDSTANAMKVFDGSNWLSAYASLSGALIANNNLSDLNNAATARSNLGLSVADGLLSQNNFTNADHTKLDGIEASADVTDTANVVAALTAGTNITIAANGAIASTDTNTTYSIGDGGLSQINFTSADHTKLDGIEASANNYTLPTNISAASLDISGGITSGSDIISDTDSTDSLGSTTVRWLKGWFDTLTAGTLTAGSGSVTDSSGAISFGDENLSTTGTLASGTLDVTGAATLDGKIIVGNSGGVSVPSASTGIIGAAANAGLILGGSGTTDDVRILNKDLANVITIPTGTTSVVMSGALTVSGSYRQTTAPATHAHASADDLVLGTTVNGNSGMTIVSGTGGYGNVFFSNGTTAAEQYSGYLQYVHSADKLSFGVGGLHAMDLTSTGLSVSGNILAGTATAAYAQTDRADDLVVGSPTGHGGITVVTSPTSTGALYFSDGTAAANRYAGHVYYNHNLDELVLGAAATNLLTVSSAGLAVVGDVKASGAFTRSLYNSGYLEGGYNNIGASSTDTGPIYIIGSGYQPFATTLNNMYGIGYAHTNASFINFTGASGWGQYVAGDGDARVWLGAQNGVISSTGQHYVGANVVWNAGNDGAGSGLDADTLDGVQASTFLGKGGGAMQGLFIGRVCTTTTVAAANDGGSMSIRGNTTKPAVISFHRAGAYAVNFGLSTANKMELGGWSASSIKHTWDFAGNYTAVGSITAYSDIRVKTNIEVIPKALDKVCQLSGYTFDRTDFVPDAETGVMPETRQTGVIAQEVLKVLPEAVSEMDDGKLTVAYGNMVGLLIESIKELKTEIEELKAQIGE